MTKDDKMILAVRRDHIIEKGASFAPYLTGLNAASVLNSIVQHATWVKRGPAETDPEWLQIIPYCVTYSPKGEVCLMSRNQGQGEARLHGFRYAGVGGHIDDTDCAFDDDVEAVIRKAARRETEEELGFSKGLLVFTGIVSALQAHNPLVQRVHIGIVYAFFAPGTEFLSSELHLHDPKWVAPVNLRAETNDGRDLEPWSFNVLCAPTYA